MIIQMILHQIIDLVRIKIKVLLINVQELEMHLNKLYSGKYS